MSSLIKTKIKFNIYQIRVDLNTTDQNTLLIKKNIWSNVEDQSVMELEHNPSTNMGASIILKLVENGKLQNFQQIELGDYIEVFYDANNVFEGSDTLQFFGQIWQVKHHENQYNYHTKVQARDYISLMNNVFLPKSQGRDQIVKLTNYDISQYKGNITETRNESNDSLAINSDLLDYIDGSFTRMLTFKRRELKSRNGLTPFDYIVNQGISGKDSVRRLSIKIHFISNARVGTRVAFRNALNSQYADLIALYPKADLFVEYYRVDQFSRIDELINESAKNSPFSINIYRFITAVVTIKKTNISVIGEVVAMDQFALAVLGFSALINDHGIDRIVRPIIEIERNLIKNITATNRSVGASVTEAGIKQQTTMLIYGRFYIQKLPEDLSITASNISNYRRIGVYNLDSFSKLNEYVSSIPEINISFIERFLITNSAHLLNDNTDVTSFIALLLSSIPFGTERYYHTVYDTAPNVVKQYKEALKWVKDNKDEGLEYIEFDNGSYYVSDIEFQHIRNDLELAKVFFLANAIRNNNFMFKAFLLDSKLINYINGIPGNYLAGAKQLGARYQTYPTEFISILRFVSLIVTSNLGFMPTNNQVIGNSNFDENRHPVFAMNNVIIDQVNMIVSNTIDKPTEREVVVDSVDSVTKFTEGIDDSIFKALHYVKMRFRLADNLISDDIEISTSEVENITIHKPSTSSYYGKYDVRNVYIPTFVREVYPEFSFSLAYDLDRSLTTHVAPMSLLTWSLLDIVKSKTYNPIISKRRINFSNIPSSSGADTIIRQMPVSEPFIAPVLLPVGAKSKPSRVREHMVLLEREVIYDIEEEINQDEEQEQEEDKISTSNILFNKEKFSLREELINTYTGTKLVAISSFCDYSDTIREIQTLAKLSTIYSRPHTRSAGTESIFDQIIIDVPFQFSLKRYDNNVKALVFIERINTRGSLSVYINRLARLLAEITVRDMAWTLPISGKALSILLPVEHITSYYVNYSYMQAVDQLSTYPIDIRINPASFEPYKNHYAPVIYLDLVAKAVKNFMWNIAKSRYSAVVLMPTTTFATSQLKNTVFRIGTRIVFRVDKDFKKSIGNSSDKLTLFVEDVSKQLGFQLEQGDGNAISTFKDGFEDTQYFTWFVVENNITINQEGFKQRIGLNEGSFDKNQMLDYTILGTRLIESFQINQMGKYFLSRKGY